jgi:outer membrane protein TolC
MFRLLSILPLAPDGGTRGGPDGRQPFARAVRLCRRAGRRSPGEVPRPRRRALAPDRRAGDGAPGRELVDLLSATARARYASGGAEQEKLLKAQLQVTRLEERKEDHHAERRALVAELNRWLDRPGGSPLGVVAALPAAAPSAPSWEARAVAGSSRVRVARAGVATAERRLASARLDLKPDLTPAAAFATRGPLGPVLTLNLDVELPFWRHEKQPPRIRAAEAEARAEAARLASETSRADRQIVRYREGIVPQSSATFDAARSSYLAGRGDFSNLVEDFNLWLEARVQLARREADRYTAWAGLEALTGGLPSPPSGWPAATSSTSCRGAISSPATA